MAAARAPWFSKRAVVTRCTRWGARSRSQTRMAGTERVAMRRWEAMVKPAGDRNGAGVELSGEMGKATV